MNNKRKKEKEKKQGVLNQFDKEKESHRERGKKEEERRGREEEGRRGDVIAYFSNTGTCAKEHCDPFIRPFDFGFTGVLHALFLIFLIFLRHKFAGD